MNNRLSLGRLHHNARSFISREDTVKVNKMRKSKIIQVYNSLRTNYLNLLLENAYLKRRIKLLENKKIAKFERRW